jgi:acyl carrier protein
MENHNAALAIIAKISKVAVEKITLEMELVGDLGFDSARALELLVELEDLFGIEIDDEQAAEMNTVADILGFLARIPHRVS